MRRLTLIQFLMIASMVLFTNCGGFQKSQDSSLAGTAQFNGGGHSGKVTYLSTQLEGDPCLAPTRALEFGNGQTQAFTYACGGTTQDPFDVTRLISYAFDPNFLIFNEQIYARDTLLQLQPNERAQFQIYCASAESAEEGVSFAMKASRFSTATGMMTVTTGYVLRNGVLRDEVGRIHDPDAQGARLFRPEQNDYEVVIGARTSPTRAPGDIVFKSDGRHVGLQCYVKEVVPDPGPANANSRANN
jgi:hypothetical protein